MPWIQFWFAAGCIAALHDLLRYAVENDTA